MCTRLSPMTLAGQKTTDLPTAPIAWPRSSLHLPQTLDWRCCHLDLPPTLCEFAHGYNPANSEMPKTHHMRKLYLCERRESIAGPYKSSEQPRNHKRKHPVCGRK